MKTVMTTNKVWCHVTKLRDWDEAPTLLNPHCFCAIRANANTEKKNTSLYYYENRFVLQTSRHDCVTSCSSYLENTGSLEFPSGFPGSHFENCCSILMQPLGPAHSSKHRVLKRAAILAPPQQDGQNHHPQ